MFHFMNQTSWSRIWSTSTTVMSRKPLQRRRKNLRLQVDPRQRQNWGDLPVSFKDFFIFKENGLILNQDLNSIKHIQRQKDWTLFFDGELSREEDGRSNSGDWKMTFRTNLSSLNVDAMMYGRARWDNKKECQYWTDPRDSQTLILIPWIRITKTRESSIWPNHVLHRTRKSGKGTKIRCTGSIYSLLNEKDWSSIKQDRTKSSSTLIVSWR